MSLPIAINDPTGFRRILTRNVALPLGNTLSLRLECFNVFDRVQWGFPNNDIASATFGQVTTQFNSPRIWQAGVRLIY